MIHILIPRNTRFKQAITLHKFEIKQEFKQVSHSSTEFWSIMHGEIFLLKHSVSHAAAAASILTKMSTFTLKLRKDLGKV